MLEAMMAYDDAVAELKQSWKDQRHLTPWGRQQIERRPDITIEE